MITQRTIGFILTAAWMAAAPLAASSAALPTRDDLRAVLAKAESIGPVQYDIISTMDLPNAGTEKMPPNKAKVWQKLPFMRVESASDGPGVRMIVRPEATYFYNVAKKGYVKAPEGSMAPGSSPKSFRQLSEEMMAIEGLRIEGVETVDGEETTVVAYPIPGKENRGTAKVWFSNRLGVPLRMESVSKLPEGEMKIRVEYKNYRFDEIPDSVFDVSAQP
jgi:outer membrane lipoprotein-sorting protein